MGSTLNEKPPLPYQTLINGDSPTGGTGQKKTNYIAVEMPSHQEILMESLTPTRNPYRNDLVEEIRKGDSDKWPIKYYIASTLLVVIMLLLIALLCLHAPSGSDVNYELIGNRTVFKFFSKKNYTGAFFMPLPGWEEGCVNIPDQYRARSIHIGPNCIEVFEIPNCLGNIGDKIFEGSDSHDDLEKIAMGRKISSFKSCS